ncbi:hypothetical protein HDU97_010205 [Phlyctochytrium planicorne]|nr:hypothetical protein HDU97_010205 [Phlyctochytrium planicorne]
MRLFRLDTRYLKRIEFPFISRSSSLYLLEEEPLLSDTVVYPQHVSDFSWVDGFQSAQQNVTVLTESSAYKKIKAKVASDGVVLHRFVVLNKRGRVMIDYELPEEFCVNHSPYKLALFIVNTAVFDLESSLIYLDIKEDAGGCSGTIGYEAKYSGIHSISFFSSIQTKVTGGQIKIDGTTPYYRVLGSKVIEACSGFCKFNLNTVKTRNAFVLLVEDSERLIRENVISFRSNNVGRAVIYGPLYFVAFALVFGLLFFSFTTCCCGFSPVSAYKRLRGIRNQDVVVVEYQPVPGSTV